MMALVRAHVWAVAVVARQPARSSSLAVGLVFLRAIACRSALAAREAGLQVIVSTPCHSAQRILCRCGSTFVARLAASTRCDVLTAVSRALFDLAAL